MSFTRQNPSGWAAGAKLLSSQINGIDINLAKAVDKTGDTITGAIVFSAASTLTFTAGSIVTLSGTTLFTNAAQTTSTFEFTNGATCQIDTGATCTFQSGGVCHFGVGSTITGSLTITGSSTISANVSITTPAVLEIAPGAILNVDPGASATFQSGSTIVFAGASTQVGIMTLIGAGLIARKTRAVTGTAYVVDTSGALTDEIVAVNNTSGGVYTVTLPLTSSLKGRELVVSDAAYTANVHQIDLLAVGGDSFGIGTGITLQIINTQGGMLRYTSDGAGHWIPT